MVEIKKPLVVIAGPTAVGKTDLSIALAKKIRGEIISADSMQVYRGMDIGTAKISPEEMQGIPHHLLDILEPTESFNVSDFQRRAKQAMEDIWQRGNIPILVGGTGFYIQSVLYDISFEETERDEQYREMLQQFVAEKGALALHQELAKVDAEAAEQIHPNNIKRVIRGLEYYHLTGEKISKHNQEQRRKTSPYCFCYFVLRLPRTVLYPRINARVDQMREAGLTQEVKRLLEEGCTKSMVSMQGLGYKEIIDALEGRCSMEEAYERIKKETRHFAKRQFTWFRREGDVTWVDKDKFPNGETLCATCLSTLREKEIIK